MTLTRKSLVLTLAAAGLAGALSACAPLILGGAAIGAIVTFDRRTSGAQLEDEGIELRGASRLREAMGERAHVNITSYNRQVLLTGEVPNEQTKQTAEQVASRVDNVKAVVNDLAVLPNATLAQRSTDALITGKVKASLVDERDLYVGAFKVVTERGVVYLMGLATRRETDRATEIARGVSGVRKVVRVVEIVSEADLANQGQQGGTGSAPPPSSSSRVPLPPMEPLPPPAGSQPMPAGPAGGATATPVR